MEKQSLIVLFYYGNFSGRIITIDEAEEKYTQENFSLSLKDEKWTFEGVNYSIGTDFRFRLCGKREGIIGIYDRTNIKHLKSMLSHLDDATEDDRGPI